MSQLRCIYRREYAVESLAARGDGRIFLPLSDLNLVGDSSYLIVIQGSERLGCGQSYEDFFEKQYFMRGFYEANHDGLMHVVAGRASVSFRLY